MLRVSVGWKKNRQNNRANHTVAALTCKYRGCRIETRGEGEISIRYVYANLQRQMCVNAICMWIKTCAQYQLHWNEGCGRNQRAHRKIRDTVAYTASCKRGLWAFVVNRVCCRKKGCEKIVKRGLYYIQIKNFFGPMGNIMWKNSKWCYKIVWKNQNKKWPPIRLVEFVRIFSNKIRLAQKFSRFFFSGDAIKYFEWLGCYIFCLHYGALFFSLLYLKSPTAQ